MKEKIVLVKRGREFVWVDDDLSLHYGFPPLKVKKSEAHSFSQMGDYAWVDDDLSMHYGFPPFRVKKSETHRFQHHPGGNFENVDDDLSLYYGFPPIKISRGKFRKREN